MEARGWQERLHAAIPGGSHTYAKGDDQYPENAPPLLARGKGCHVWDLTATSSSSTAWGCGRSRWVMPSSRSSRRRPARCALGINFNRPSPSRSSAPRSLLGLIDRGGHGEVRKERLGRHDRGGPAGPRLHRPRPGRRSATQPFFSTDDWFIGTTPMPRGYPRERSGS